MAINELLINNETSAEDNPTTATSDVIIEGGSPGKIWLQAQISGSSNWVNVTSESGAFSLNTPDTTITYRFRAENVDSSTRVSFGP